MPDSREDMLAAGYSDTLKRNGWDRIMTLPMRFNRLILFSPWQFHNAGAAFGTGPDNGRLVQTFFFAAA